jgi:hypothetical protein
MRKVTTVTAGTEQLGLFAEEDLAPAGPSAAAQRYTCQVVVLDPWTVATADQLGGGREELGYRSWCRTCQVEGPRRETNNEAARDACDHGWPRWEDQPLMPARPSGEDGQKALPDWLALARRLYPAGWVDAGGPIRTSEPSWYRAHDETEWGGFGMACGT